MKAGLDEGRNWLSKCIDRREDRRVNLKGWRESKDDSVWKGRA